MTRAYLLLFQQYDRGKKATDECVALLTEMKGEPINVDTCEGVMQKVVHEPGGAEYVSPLFCRSCIHNFTSAKSGLCLNIYDVRLKDEIPACGMNWPTDLKNITSYLRVYSFSFHRALGRSLMSIAARCRECVSCRCKVGSLGRMPTADPS